MPFPQFIMRINFHFSNKKNPAEGHFIVGEDLKRKVPLEVEGINGLNTVYMLFPESDLYLADETVIVKCGTIAPKLYKRRIKPGLKGRLWESGYFADIEILEVNDNAFTWMTNKFNEFETLLEQSGWKFSRQKGSHRLWYSPNNQPLPIQTRKYGKAKLYQVKQFLRCQYEEQ